MTSVVVSDPTEYVKVMRGEGRCPIRFELAPSVHYLKKRGMSLGLVNEYVDHWLISDFKNIIIIMASRRDTAPC